MTANKNTEITDTKICPICQGNNQCGVQNEENCWCMAIDVPTELIKSLNNRDNGKTCICQACIDKFKLGKSI